MNDKTWPDRIRHMRRKQLNVNRDRFASLIGFSVKPVSSWENGKTNPDALGVVILELLENVLIVQPREVVLGTLHHMGFDQLSLMRALAWMERREPLSQPILSFTLDPSFSISSEPNFWPEQIKHLRERLDLTQQGFANLIGFTNATVSRWETGDAVPAGLGAAVLVMLSTALRGHSINVIGPLKEAAGETLPLIRALTWLERHPAHTGPMLAITSAPPPSTRPPPFVTRLPTRSRR